MIRIIIDEKCPACGNPHGLTGEVVIDREHVRVTEHENDEAVFDSPSCADSYWSHPGFEMDQCIRISCFGCGAQACLDIGEMEVTCTSPQRDPGPSWCPPALGEMRTSTQEKMDDAYEDMRSRATAAREIAKKARKAGKLAKWAKYCAVARVYEMAARKLLDMNPYVPF